ncbi:MAG: amino acid ABC transporter substrate-binding protein, partial [Anaerolineae bacterium]|nr:amino acid ABC transporter substrate-binding protein [Anaerolineae bacterium]
MRRIAAACCCLLLSAAYSVAPLAAAEPVAVPVLVPLTGFLALEGASQRNGALLALSQAPAGRQVRANVIDTGAAPEGAVNALER